MSRRRDRTNTFSEYRADRMTTNNNDRLRTGLTELGQRGRRVRRQTSRLRRRAGVRIKIYVPYGLGVSGRARRRVDHVHELRVGAVQTVRPQRHVLETGTGRVKTCGVTLSD